mmetsp:Transcript_4032/g.10371  ORF Transcript_4032/g.10371 Transcript_4032/m.10371 type:complete len:278 (-) Transcript_4032:208-1041(-)
MTRPDALRLWWLPFLLLSGCRRGGGSLLCAPNLGLRRLGLPEQQLWGGGARVMRSLLFRCLLLRLWCCPTVSPCHPSAALLIRMAAILAGLLHGDGDHLGRGLLLHFVFPLPRRFISVFALLLCLVLGWPLFGLLPAFGRLLRVFLHDELHEGRDHSRLNGSLRCSNFLRGLKLYLRARQHRYGGVQPLHKIEIVSVLVKEAFTGVPAHTGTRNLLARSILHLAPDLCPIFRYERAPAEFRRKFLYILSRLEVDECSGIHGSLQVPLARNEANPGVL